MAKNVINNDKTVATFTHEEARRKNIPTAEFQSVMDKDEQSPRPVAYERGAAELKDGKAGYKRQTSFRK